MTQLSISIRNADIVRQGLQDLGAEVPRIGRLGIYRMEQTVVRRMKEYWTLGQPPPVPSYIRTGTLAGGYFISPTSNGYQITNNTPYTEAVVGNAYGLGQAWMHYRHPLLRNVMDEEVEKLPPEIEREISLVARRVGL